MTATCSVCVCRPGICMYECVGMLYMYACYFLVVLFHLIARHFQCSIVFHTIHGK